MRRLACYDAAFPLPDATREAAERQARDRFGSPAPATSTPQTPVPDRLEARLLEVQRLPRGERVFVLDNQQRWQEAQAGTRGELKPGDAVVIEKASFGSFLLVTPAGVGLRVRRLP